MMGCSIVMFVANMILQHILGNPNVSVPVAVLAGDVSRILVG